MKLKGYRTVAAAIVMSLATTGAVQYSSLPPDAQHLLTLLTDAWGLIMILLRMATTTPVGKQVEAEIEKELGLTPAQMDLLVAKLPQKADVAALSDAVSRLSADVRKAVPATAAPAPGAV